ncbi:hypothetical protein M446_4147 [Methylobacterium sp. 4-46]|uniref:hypothetical protein n=1 Tax=unclassified Methylobacterium TaxID=2615210 RepID=UPI000165C91C|nr:MULTISPECIES: hypothetical protein [Methylobacterium]ACA18504.1 hypothetical protein M446_4147 [Methylobacterium sp. 4-46]WFT77792.1 hypothetical protein QA634_21060 [Methylobacterium nodulans]
MIPLEQAARLLLLSTMRLRQLAKEGWFPPPVRGKVSLILTVQGYIKFLRDEDRRSSKTAAESGLKQARQREVELRIAKDEGELIPLLDVMGVMDEFTGAVVTALKNMPSRFSRDIAQRERLQPHVDEVLTLVADKMQAAAGEARALRG